MRLIELTLKNVGIYSGRVTVPLETTKEKPVVLIGGINGRGKTTILEAIQLVLFGKNSTNVMGAYRAYLFDLIHTEGDPPPSEASIELVFSMKFGGETFRIQRAWRKGSGREALESFNVFTRLAGEEKWKPSSFWAKNWYDLFQRVMPSQLAHLFFIDGEKISGHAEPDKIQELIQSATNTLVGTDIVDKLKHDLGVMDKEEKIKNALESGLLSKEELGKYQEQDRCLLESREQAEKSLAEVEEKLKEAEKKLKDAENDWGKKGGQAAENREQLKNSKHQEEKQLLSEEEQLRGLLGASPSPLCLVPEELQDLLDAGSQESGYRKNREKLAFLDEVQQGIEDITGSFETVNSEHQAAIFELFEAKKKELLPPENFQEVYKLSDSAIAIIKESSEGRGELLSRAKEVQEKIAGWKGRLEDLDGQLEMVPDEKAIQGVIQKLRQCEKSRQKVLGQVEVARNRKEECLNELIKFRNEFGALLEKHTEAGLADEDRKRFDEHKKRVIRTLSSFKEVVLDWHREKIGRVVFSSLKKLLKKQELCSGIKLVGEDYELQVLGPRPKRVPRSVERLSAAERKLLTVSIFWGLVQIPDKMAPVVIDTPLSSMDSGHKDTLVKEYFPRAGAQVILLSTDEEIVGRHYENLKPFISREHTIKFDEKTGSSSILHDVYEFAEEAVGV